MPNMAKVSILGHVGRDPELKTLPSGQSVCSFSVAVTSKKKDSESTDWFAVSAWGRLGEVCAEHLTKGSAVFVEGRLSTRSYQASNGENRVSLEVNANEMQMVGGKRDGDSSAAPDPDDQSIPF